MSGSGLDAWARRRSHRRYVEALLAGGAVTLDQLARNLELVLGAKVVMLTGLPPGAVSGFASTPEDGYAVILLPEPRSRHDGWLVHVFGHEAWHQLRGDCNSQYCEREPEDECEQFAERLAVEVAARLNYLAANNGRSMGARMLASAWGAG